MAGHDYKSMDFGWKWLEIAGNGLKWLIMTGNGWKLLEMV